MAQALDIVNLFADLEVAKEEGRLVLADGTTVQGALTQGQGENPDFYQVSARIPVKIAPNGVDGLTIEVDDTSIEVLATAPTSPSTP